MSHTPLKLTIPQEAAFEAAIQAMSLFRQAFGRELSKDFIAEVYAALHLGLTISSSSTQSGYDAVDTLGQRYQIKYRAITTPKIEVQNFEFDYLILVNLDESYQLIGIWRITREQAEAIAVHRDKQQRYQTTQKEVKAIGERLF